MPRDKRRLFLRDLACEVIQREKVVTTLARAKEVRRRIDRIITLGKRAIESGESPKIEAARRKVFDRLQRELAVAKVFDVLVDRYRKRAGGYTRMIRINPRVGDGAEMVILELVDRPSEVKEKEKSKKKTK